MIRHVPDIISDVVRVRHSDGILNMDTEHDPSVRIAAALSPLNEDY